MNKVENNNNTTDIENGNNSSVDSNNNNSVKKYRDELYCTRRLFWILWVTFNCSLLYGIAYPPDVLHRPQLPEFEVNSLEVTSMKVVYNNNNNNVTNDYYSIVGYEKHLMADLDINLTLKNKNQGLMYFSPLQVSLEYHHDEFLSSTMLEPFLLLEDQRLLQFGMQIKDDDARLESKTVDSISRDLQGQNVVQFTLKAKGHLACPHRNAFDNCVVNLLCDDIKVRFLTAKNLTTGSMIDSPLLCKCKNDCHSV